MALCRYSTFHGSQSMAYGQGQGKSSGETGIAMCWLG